MQLWAAIDFLEGSVVTLTQGRASERTVWPESPSRLAERWQEEGADGLHLVDLDAAFQKGSNRDAILEIIGASRIPVEVGGGVRSPEAVGEWLDAGATRVVVGTLAYREPRALSGLLATHGPERIVVAADYRDGRITTKGWTTSQGLTLSEAVARMEENGVRNILATSVERDGMGSGPDLETISGLCRSTKMNVIASGGIRDLRDLEALERAGARGAIIGRALYDGSVQISRARSVG